MPHKAEARRLPQLPPPLPSKRLINPYPLPQITSFSQPVANQRVDPVITRAEPAQLDSLPVLDLLGVAIAPFDRHLAVGVGVDEYVEGAVPV